MRIVSRMTGGIAAAALVVSMASPAAARSWGGDWHHSRHHRDGPSAGEVIGAVAAIGLIAAIASAGKKKADQERYEGPPPQDRYDDYDDQAPRYDNGAPDTRYDDARGETSQDMAVDACLVAARDKASRSGDFAEVRGVTGVNPSGAGWNVQGTVEQRSSYRASDGWTRNFHCSWQDGQIDALTLD